MKALITIFTVLFSFKTLTSIENLKTIHLGQFEAIDKVRFGGESSGGGTAIVCRDQNKKISNIQMLDIYEGKILLGLHYINETKPFKKQVQDYIQRLSFDRSLVMDMQKAVKEIYEDIRFLPQGVIIHAPGDLGDNEAVILPNGCELSGVGFYEKKHAPTDDAILRVSRDYFDNMTEFQKTAFILHEALYSIYRFYYSDYHEDDRTAKRTRVFVANLMSDFPSHNLEELSSFFRWSQLDWASYTNPLFIKKNSNASIRFKYTSNGYNGISFELYCMETASFHTFEKNSIRYYSKREFVIQQGNQVIMDLNENCTSLWIEGNPTSINWMDYMTVEIIDKNNKVIRKLNEDDLSAGYSFYTSNKIHLPLYTY